MNKAGRTGLLRLGDRGWNVLTRAMARGPTLSLPIRYLLASGLTLAAVLVRLAITPQEDGLPYVTFFPAATLAAIFGGLGAGLFATVLGAGIAVYLFIPPFDTVKFDASAMISASVFIFDEVIVCSAIEAMRRYYLSYVDTVSALEAANATAERARFDAERANEAKSRFLAAASHDLRQPYQALRLYHAALQARTAPEAVTEDILARMDHAMAAGEDLLQSLLQLSTLDAGIIVPKPVDVQVKDVMTSMEHHHRPVAEEKGLKFRVSKREGMVHIDPVLLGRILDNLVSNAIRYTETGGVLVAFRLRDGKPTFEVWDTGVGIPPDHQEAVFEEFYQIGNDGRERSKGTGLGLAVVSRMANLMGLRIAMTSRPGQGTRIGVTVPA